jgi:hypothetical protein
MIIAKIQAEVNPHPIKKGMSNLSLIEAAKEPVKLRQPYVKHKES